MSETRDAILREFARGDDDTGVFTGWDVFALADALADALAEIEALRDAVLALLDGGTP